MGDIDMAAVSAALRATASNAGAPDIAVLLRGVARALAAAPLPTLAESIGRDDTTACRIRSEEVKVTISDAVRLLHAAGLKAVPLRKVCVDREVYQAMTTIASRAMADEQTARRLTWDEDQ